MPNSDRNQEISHKKNRLTYILKEEEEVKKEDKEEVSRAENLNLGPLP